MKKVFWACLLILLSLTVIVSGYRIGLLGSLAGCLLLIVGLRRIAKRERPFEDVRRCAYLVVIDIVIICMSWISKGSYIAKLEGADIVNAAIVVLLQVIILRLYVSGIRNIEEQNSIMIGGEWLWKGWIWLAVFQVVSALSMIVQIRPVFLIILSAAMSMAFLALLSVVTYNYVKWEMQLGGL